jgi:hypothetical protein
MKKVVATEHVGSGTVVGGGGGSDVRATVQITLPLLNF